MNKETRLEGWQKWLGDPAIDADLYLELVGMGENKKYCKKIKDDTHRTFASDAKFKEKVSESALIRVLNCYCNYTGDAAYVQGMNLFAGVFLYLTGNEAVAFTYLSIWNQFLCPSFSGFKDGGVQGAMKGCEAINHVMKEVDEELAGYLKKKGAIPTVWAFRVVLSLFASSPPLDEVLKIWDILLERGLHLVYYLIVARVVYERDSFISTNNDNNNIINNNPLLKLQQLFDQPFEADVLIPKALEYYNKSSNTIVDMTKSTFY